MENSILGLDVEKVNSTSEENFKKVNIGGMIFLLNPNVVASSGYFQGMVNMNPREKDFSKIIIDRNWFHFSFILDCIRDPAYYENKIEKLQDIKPELEYFQFENLLKVLSTTMPESHTSRISDVIKITKKHPTAHYEVFDNDEIVIDFCDALNPASVEGNRRVLVRSNYFIFPTGLEIIIPTGYICLVKNGVVSNNYLSAGTHTYFNCFTSTGSDYAGMDSSYRIVLQPIKL